MDKLKLIFYATLVFIIIFSAIGLISLLMPYLTSYIPSEYAAYIKSIIFISIFLGVPLFLFSRWTTKHYRKMSFKELKACVFTYEEEYFEFIGQEDDSVRRFKELIEKKDISSLKTEWNSLKKRFLKLESAAGHTGRPLILDY